MRPERVTTYIVGVAGVARGSVAADAPRVPVAAADQAVDDSYSDIHIAGAFGKAVPVVGVAGDASARDVAAVART